MAERDDNEPPMILDGARVLEYAPIDARANRGASAVVAGVAVDLQNVAGVAIVEDLARGALFLLHCNRDWETLTAAPCATPADARAQAEEQFPGAMQPWRPYRALTPEESAELESTRRFLRELVAGEPEA